MASDLSRISGRPVRVDPEHHERVTITLRGCEWRLAAEVIAKMAKGELVEQPDGVLLFEPYARFTCQFDNADVDDILILVAAYANQPLVLAPDVKGKASVDYQECGTSDDRRRLLMRLIGENGLSAWHAGEVLVVARAKLDGPCEPPSVRESFRETPRGVFLSWSAPAKEWFALVERATGVRAPEYGRAPIDFCLVDVPVATALGVGRLLSRAEAPEKALADLAPMTTLESGRVVALDVQATVTGIERPLALVDGRIVAPGDLLEKGVRLVAIQPSAIVVEENGGVRSVIARTGP